MDQTYPKSMRLRRRQEFRAILKCGTSRHGRFLSIHYCSASPRKLGISVSKKFGHAPARSQFKRLVREAFRLSELPNVTLHVRPGPQAKSASFSEIQEEMNYLLTV